MDEDWAVLRSFLPAGWEDLGRSTGALKGLRKDKAAAAPRVRLLPLGCGHSLREIAVRARPSGCPGTTTTARAWLYGKLRVALLVDKLVDHARAVSPWGYEPAASQAA